MYAAIFSKGRIVAGPVANWGPTGPQIALIDPDTGRFMGLYWIGDNDVYSSTSYVAETREKAVTFARAEHPEAEVES